MKRTPTVALLLLAVLLGWVVWSWQAGGVVATLLATDIAAPAKVDALRAFFEGWGALAPLAYVAVVTVEVVVAPLPGVLLYLPAGLIFGGLLGGSLALLGNVLGAGIACHLMRSVVGPAWSHRWFSRRGLERYESMIARHGLWIIALLRVNPLTSSDLVSYAAGLAPIRVPVLMLGTLIGIAPLCYLQAYLAQELFRVFPWTVWLMVGVAIAYAVAGFLVLRKLAAEGPPASGSPDRARPTGGTDQ